MVPRAHTLASNNTDSQRPRFCRVCLILSTDFERLRRDRFLLKGVKISGQTHDNFISYIINRTLNNFVGFSAPTHANDAVKTSTNIRPLPTSGLDISRKCMNTASTRI